MLSAEGGDCGRHESSTSMSLPCEGVRGLLVLLTLLESPRDGLQMVMTSTALLAVADFH